MGAAMSDHDRAIHVEGPGHPPDDRAHPGHDRGHPWSWVRPYMTMAAPGTWRDQGIGADDCGHPGHDRDHQRQWVRPYMTMTAPVTWRDRAIRRMTALIPAMTAAISGHG